MPSCSRRPRRAASAPGPRGDADGHAVQPRTDGVRRAQGPRLAEEDEECRLEGVVHVGRMHQHPPASAQDHRPQPGDERLEGELVAPDRKPFEEFPFRQARGGAGVEQPDQIRRRDSLLLHRRCPAIRATPLSCRPGRPQDTTFFPRRRENPRPRFAIAEIGRFCYGKAARIDSKIEGPMDVRASTRTIWLMGDLEDPWVRLLRDSIAGLAPCGPSRTGGRRPGPSVRSRASARDPDPAPVAPDPGRRGKARRMAPLHRDPTPFPIILCYSPYVRYAELERGRGERGPGDSRSHRGRDLPRHVARLLA